MYKCNDCGRFFEEPIYIYDDPSPSGVSLPSGHYTYWECPACGSEDVEEAGKCASCGEPVTKGETLCDDCRSDLRECLLEIADKMHMDNEEMESAVAEVYWG